MQPTSPDFTNLLGKVVSIDRKLDAMTTAFSAMADAVIAEVKSNAETNKLMQKFFEKELELLDLTSEERKAPITKADENF